MTQESKDLPVAVWSGSFRLFGVDVRCHRLSDGRAFIEEGSMCAILEAMADGSMEAGDLEAFVRFQKGLEPVTGEASNRT
jgi:hypothetical protein